MSFKVGEAVRWTSSNTRKEGVIEAVVPVGRLPRDVGFPKIGDTSLPRDHESYVVRGGVPGQRVVAYWPLASLLHAITGLTADELSWCHQNASRIREMMAST